MAVLIGCFELTQSFGARALFTGLSFSIEEKERVALIGPNGAGKSTLLRILAGKMRPDEGKVSFTKGIRTGYLEQTPQFEEGATLFSTLMEGAEDPDDWQAISLAEELTSKLNLGQFGSDTLVSKLSGGWKKRVALARELMKNPDLLLLDEPTNHLDLDSIIWLEDFLRQAPFATLTITHDRAFLQKICDRILEVDRRNKNGILSIKGTYADYVETKQNQIQQQASQEDRMRNTLRREVEWLRQGAKARTTKQQARIQRAGELATDVEDISYKNQKREVKFDFEGNDRNPKKLIEAKSISKTYGDRTLFKDLSLRLTPKTRLGLLGENGSGKSSLIRTLLKIEKPTSGEVIHADAISVAYFEQNRELLNKETTLFKTICPEGEFVDYRGARIHARGYLSKFLFDSQQLILEVGKLSGGEQSRLLLAMLMLKKANVLILDEPTNDLDLETLKVLEDAIHDFDGAVLIVTHDRYFLDQVCTQILAFDPDGLMTYQGLGQWEEARLNRIRAVKVAAKQEQKASSSGPKKKLSFNDQREFDSIEGVIHEKEKALERLTFESANPAHLTNAIKLTELSHEMTKLSKEIETLYARWSELEAKQK